MNVLAGLFLVAHGLVHLAIWLPRPSADAPFDPGRSWLLGDVRRLAQVLAIAAAVLLALAGIRVLAGAGAGPAVAGAAVSLGLVGLTFHAWPLAAIALDVAIVVVALA